MERLERFMSYKRHVIYIGTDIYGDTFYCVALKRNGTDEYFKTYEEAMDAINKYEDGRKRK